jgi:hypothetical protein
VGGEVHSAISLEFVWRGRGGRRVSDSKIGVDNRSALIHATQWREYCSAVLREGLFATSLLTVST